MMDMATWSGKGKASRELGKNKYARGMYVGKLDLRSMTGELISIPGEDKLVHLQFRRFAGCPVCHLHLHMFAMRNMEITQARIVEIVIFHSTKQELLKYAGQLPFQIIPDPEKKLYKAWGVESSLKSVFNVSAIIPIFRSVGNSLVQFLKRKQALPPVNPKGGSLGLPADFLIAPDGRIVECKYGKHADDQWSVDELLQIAKTVYH